MKQEYLYSRVSFPQAVTPDVSYQTWLFQSQIFTHIRSQRQ